MESYFKTDPRNCTLRADSLQDHAALLGQGERRGRRASAHPAHRLRRPVRPGAARAPAAHQGRRARRRPERPHRDARRPQAREPQAGRAPEEDLHPAASETTAQPAAHSAACQSNLAAEQRQQPTQLAAGAQSIPARSRRAEPTQRQLRIGKFARKVHFLSLFSFSFSFQSLLSGESWLSFA